MPADTVCGSSSAAAAAADGDDNDSHAAVLPSIAASSIASSVGGSLAGPASTAASRDGSSVKHANGEAAGAAKHKHRRSDAQLSWFGRLFETKAAKAARTSGSPAPAKKTGLLRRRKAAPAPAAAAAPTAAGGGSGATDPDVPGSSRGGGRTPQLADTKRRNHTMKEHTTAASKVRQDSTAMRGIAVHG
jgi:hypothetical protein